MHLLLLSSELLKNGDLTLNAFSHVYKTFTNFIPTFQVSDTYSSTEESQKISTVNINALMKKISENLNRLRYQRNASQEFSSLFQLAQILERALYAILTNQAEDMLKREAVVGMLVAGAHLFLPLDSGPKSLFTIDKLVEIQGSLPKGLQDEVRQETNRYGFTLIKDPVVELLPPDLKLSPQQLIKTLREADSVHSLATSEFFEQAVFFHLQNLPTLSKMDKTLKADTRHLYYCLHFYKSVDEVASKKYEAAMKIFYLHPQAVMHSTKIAFIKHFSIDFAFRLKPILAALKEQVSKPIEDLDMSILSNSDFIDQLLTFLSHQFRAQVQFLPRNAKATYFEILGVINQLILKCVEILNCPDRSESDTNFVLKFLGCRKIFRYLEDNVKELLIDESEIKFKILTAMLLKLNKASKLYNRLASTEKMSDIISDKDYEVFKDFNMIKNLLFSHVSSAKNAATQTLMPRLKEGLHYMAPVIEQVNALKKNDIYKVAEPFFSKISSCSYKFYGSLRRFLNNHKHFFSDDYRKNLSAILSDKNNLLKYHCSEMIRFYKGEVSELDVIFLIFDTPYVKDKSLKSLFLEITDASISMRPFLMKFFGGFNSVPQQKIAKNVKLTEEITMTPSIFRPTQEQRHTTDEESEELEASQDGDTQSGQPSDSSEGFIFG